MKTTMLVFLFLFCFPGLGAAQTGHVVRAQEISSVAGGFGGHLDQLDGFGTAVDSLGDLDGDGVVELVVGAQNDSDAGPRTGAVWVLFLNADGTVKAQQKINELEGGLDVDLQEFDYFGHSVAGLGDLDGDGTGDLAVGALGLDGVASVWILLLESDGTVKAKQQIAAATGGFGGDLVPQDLFASSLGQIGDLDGDGVVDLAVGAEGDDDGGTFQGAVWILFLRPDGTVRSEQKISAVSGGFGGALDPEDLFGTSIAAVGDIDGDGVVDLAVGARGDDNAGRSKGAVWILFLRPDGTVRAEQKINEAVGGFGGDLDRDDYFGWSVSTLGDLDSDGVPDLGVGSVNDDDGGGTSGNWGAVWLLFLDRDGTVKAERKISETSGGFSGHLTEQAHFASGMHCVGDLDGDGSLDLAVGAYSGGSTFQGQVWMLFLEGAPACLSLDFETEDDFETPLVNGQHLDTEFGALVTLASSGANAGLAIFDSTPGGPNDPSQDPDLLVGTGNLLILQTENLPPDANDVFPRPNDDEDGGTITLEFELPVEPRALRLVDVDASDGPTTIVLEDILGRHRTYTVPGNWTGDRTLSQPGQGVLSLVTRTLQPGYASGATASEETGFDPFAVVRLEVQLDGSAGLDDLEVCSENLPRASIHTRNGTGVNPLLLSSSALPVLGGTWAADLDCGAIGSGMATLAVSRRSASRMTPSGEVLIEGALSYLVSRPCAIVPAHFAWNLPRSLSLIGLELHAQGLCREQAPPSAFAKIRRNQQRLSNALDLVLGF